MLVTPLTPDDIEKLKTVAALRTLDGVGEFWQSYDQATARMRKPGGCTSCMKKSYDRWFTLWLRKLNDTLSTDEMEHTALHIQCLLTVP